MIGVPASIPPRHSLREAAVALFPERTPAIDHPGIVWLQLPRQLAPVPTELTTVAAASFDLHRDSEGRARLALCGRLDAAATASCWHRLERELAGPGLPALEIDASALEACDGSGIALLHHLHMGGMTPGATVTVARSDGATAPVFGQADVSDTFHGHLRHPYRTAVCRCTHPKG